MSAQQGRNYTLQKIEKGVYDVVDFPAPGEWAGRVEKHAHRGHTNRMGWRWFPAMRSGDGANFHAVGYDHGYETLKAAADALIEVCVERAIFEDDGDYTVERIRQALALVYKPEGIDVWMTAEHEQFDGWTVTEMLNHNRGDEVLAAVERLATGAFA